MVGGEIYDAVSDVEFKFSQEFRKYVRDESLLCHKYRKYIRDDYGVARKDAWLFKKEQQPNDVESADHDVTNKLLMMFETLEDVPCDCLFQFWSTEVTNVNGFGEMHCILTTRNQPFLLTGSKSNQDASISEVICSYRRKMVGIVDGDGVIGRVFRTKRAEFTPNVGFYSYEEHPHRDLALSCGVEGSLAIPLIDSSGCSAGVLEIVSQFDIYSRVLFSSLQDELAYLGLCKDLCKQFNVEDWSLHNVVSQIRKVVGKSCNLLYAQTWMLCKQCHSLFVTKSIHSSLDTTYFGLFVGKYWSDTYMCTLKNGEGVVGKAAISSHSLVYCEDVSQFSITQYTLAHFARQSKLKTCFAIGLKSDLTGSQIYVLELFLDPSKVHCFGLTNTLQQILQVVKENFETLKLASGEKIGDDLYVLVIDAKNPHISQTVKINELNSMEYPILELDLINNVEERGVGLDIENGENVIINIDERSVAITPLEKQQQNNAQVCNDGRVDVVGTSQQPLVQVNVVHTEENIVGTSKESIVNSSKLPIRRGGIDISLEELEKVSGMKRKDAAQRLNVSVSTFKRVCRDYKISRWPPRKRNIHRVSHSGDSAQTGSTSKLQGSALAVQNESVVTIKAKYGDNFIKFSLSASSGIDTFHQQVSKRLKLEPGNYNVKYKDNENDWILVMCDEDLRDYISTSTSSEKTTLTMLLEHI